MSAERRLLLVAVCVLGVLVVAATFPAADPRLDPPGGGSSADGDWDSVTGTPERTNGVKHPTETETPEPEVRFSPVVNGDVVPGTTARVGVEPEGFEGSEYERVTMLVEGERVGEASGGEGTGFRVPPGVEEFNVTVEETGDRKMVPVETDITVSVDGHLAPGREVKVDGRIGSYRVDGATVRVDGEAIGTTSGKGSTTVELPETAREVEVALERDRLSGSYTLDVPEPEIAFSHPVIFPGAPAHLSVTADGGSVENATVVVGDTKTTTGESGRTWVGLPLADEVTVTTTVGEEQVTRTVSNLYLRTTVVVLVIPGLVIGSVWTYLRYVPHRRTGTGFAGLMLALGAFLGVLGSAIAGGAGLTRDAIRSLRLPRLSVGIPRPSLSFLGGVGFSLGLSSFGGLIDSLTTPGPSSSGSVSTSIRNAVAGSESDGESETVDDHSDSESETGDEPALGSGQAQVRDAWHTFLDHAGVRNRATRTPGDVSRQALSVGYPRESVRRLLSLFRDVEYGDTDPSPEDVTEAQTAVDTLADHDPEDDSQ